MKKFVILVKKEILELLTPQLLVPLVAVVLVFMFIGRIINKEAVKTQQTSQPVAVMDLDNSAASQGVIKTLERSNLVVNLYEMQSIDLALREAESDNEKALLVIPVGFGSGIENFTPQKIGVYSILTNFSFLGSRASQLLSVALTAANENLSNQLLDKTASVTNPAAIKRPLLIDDFVIIGDNQAHISPVAVAGFINSQTTFIPIILFLVIIFASQLIATSIASEKENKTLETLLSSPISRQTVVAAKLVGAGLASLLIAVIYLFGMRSYFSGLTGAGTGGATNEATKAAIAQLGLTFSAGDYALLGLSLFFGILAALSIAIILGSLAEDTKGAQGVIAPLMVLILIPYILTLFLDISTLSPAVKILVYAIPFSHPFLAAPNILLGQTQSVWYGILYLAVFFAVFVFLASKIFASDRIFTMKLRFRRKRQA